MNNNKELNDKELIELHQAQNIIRENFKNNKEYGFDMPIDSFFLRVKNNNPQSYGLRVEGYLSKVLGYAKIPSSQDEGDFANLEGEKVEFKCSFLDELHTNINLKQIRLWQDLKYYYVFTADFTELDNLVYKCYKLSKKEMEQECETLKAGSCHMTKANHSQNEKVEVGCTIKLGSEHFKRWEENYLLKNFNLKELSDIRLEKEFIITSLKIQLEIKQLQLDSVDVQACIDSEIEEEQTIINECELMINEIPELKMNNKCNSDIKLFLSEKKLTWQEKAKLKTSVFS